ncbi:MAG: sigma-70 family RNA polymerase sigma factor [Mesorhizobium sp.]|nr:sigma-70 family RNA polymerase sigma factor [Mesorhizobium sp.]
MNLTQMSSLERLLQRIANGERQALESLFRLEAGRMLAVARRIVRRKELAEEVVQDVFVTVWRKASQFDAEKGSARAWLTTSVRHRALNLLRDGARTDFHDPATLAELGDRAGDAQQAYQALPPDDDLRRCLDQLEPERRDSIVMAYVVGFTHGEIASQLKAPVGTVKAWIRRGVLALRECMS